MADFQVQNEGSVFLLRPLSDAAAEWLGENIAADAHWFGNAVVVEHRFIGAIVDGIVADGLQLEHDVEG